MSEDNNADDVTDGWSITVTPELITMVRPAHGDRRPRAQRIELDPSTGAMHVLEQYDRPTLRRQIEEVCEGDPPDVPYPRWDYSPNCDMYDALWSALRSALCLALKGASDGLG